MNKAKQILISEVRKLKSKANWKRKEAEKLENQADELIEKIHLIEN